MEHGKCEMKREVEDAETLLEPLFVPIKAEPHLEEPLDDTLIEDNLEATENTGDIQKENKQQPLISLSTAPDMMGMNTQGNFWKSSISLSKNLLPSSYECQNLPTVPSCSTADDAVGQEEVADVDLSNGLGEHQVAGDRQKEHSDQREEGNSPHDKDPHCRRETLQSGSLRTCTGERHFKCCDCEREFTRKVDLTRHMQIHTRNKPYSSSQNEKCFTECRPLTTLMHRSTPDWPFKCSQCGRSFTSGCNLTRHIRIHDGHYKCSVCGEAFKDNTRLNNHMHLHAVDRPFKCSYCKLSFTQSSTLSEHVRMHTGERPYSCSTCGMAFMSLSHLSSHKMRLHGASL